MPTDRHPPRAEHILFGHTLAELRALVQDGIDSGPATPFDPVNISHEGRRLLKARLLRARHD
jgi:hypothetical protein